MKPLILFLTILSLAGLSIDPALAEPQKILVKIKSCDKIKVKVINGSECEEDDFISGACKEIDECICISPERKVKWRIVSKIENKVKFKFKDAAGNRIKAPFLNQCLKDFSGDKTVCKIKAKSDLARSIFDFDIKVKGCANAHDPRIVIKKRG